MFQKQSETTWLQLGLHNRNANNKIQCTRSTNSTANRTIKLWKCKTRHNSHKTIGNLKEHSWLWSSIFWYEELADSLLLWSCFRYQFYIHIKADIIDGRLLCSDEQAVLFAAYAAQGSLIYWIHSDLLHCNSLLSISYFSLSLYSLSVQN